jgi:putative transcriptional regulator
LLQVKKGFMDTKLCLTNYFLIAMPTLSEHNFYRGVVYICEHSEQGAVGMLINRPLEMHLSDILVGMEITYHRSDIEQIPILFGGPISPEHGFVIHRPKQEWRATLMASEEIAITTSKDILQAIGEGNGPDDLMVCLGYSGWNAGQLEQEIKKNWLCCPASAEIIFNTPVEQRWDAAAKLLGIEINQLSATIGHA